MTSFTLPDLKMSYKGTRQCGIGVSKDIQANGTKGNPEIDPQVCSQLMFDKGIKTVEYGKGS